MFEHAERGEQRSSPGDAGRTRWLPGFLNVLANESCGLAIRLLFRPTCQTLTATLVQYVTALHRVQPANFPSTTFTDGARKPTREPEALPRPRRTIGRGNEGRGRGEIASGGHCLLDFEARGPLRPNNGQRYSLRDRTSRDLWNRKIHRDICLLLSAAIYITTLFPGSFLPFSSRFSSTTTASLRNRSVSIFDSRTDLLVINRLVND